MGNNTNYCLIMAGGKGDRLAPFTKVLPKPLIPINEKPVIEHIIDNLISSFNQDNDWVSFQRKYFPSLIPHDKAGETILKQITSMVN